MAASVDVEVVVEEDEEASQAEEETEEEGVVAVVGSEVDLVRNLSLGFNISSFGCRWSWRCCKARR